MNITMQNEFHKKIVTIPIYDILITNSSLHKGEPRIAIIEDEILAEALSKLCPVNIGSCPCEEGGGGQQLVGEADFGELFKIISKKQFECDFLFKVL